MLKSLLLFVALISGFAAAQERTVRTRGEAAPAAKQAPITVRALALDDALRQAIEQGIGVFINAETRVQNFELISDTILKQASGFARLDKINAEGATSAGTYFVDANVIVSSQKILSKLRDLIKSIGDPRFGVFISETLGNKPLVSSSASTQISKALIDFGFRVIDQRTLEQQIGREKLIQAQNDPKALAALATRINLDFIVVGLARAVQVAAPPEAGNGAISVQTILELRVIENTSGQVIWTDENNSADYDFSLEVATSRAMRKVAGLFTDLKGSLMNQMRELVNAGSAVVIIIKVSGFASFSAFNARLLKSRKRQCTYPTYCSYLILNSAFCAVVICYAVN